MREIARTKRLALDHQDFVDRMRDKVPGRPVPSKSQWRKLQRSIGSPLILPIELTQSDGSGSADPK
jgi:hypothetical protein